MGVKGPLPGLCSFVMSMAAGHRVRWTAIWLLVLAWFVALAANWGGGAVHLLLLGAIALLVYELLIEDEPARG